MQALSFFNSVTSATKLRLANLSCSSNSSDVFVFASSSRMRFLRLVASCRQRYSSDFFAALT